MKPIKDFTFIILFALVLLFQEPRRKRIRWSYVFLAVAIMLFIIQVIYTALTKG